MTWRCVALGELGGDELGRACRRRPPCGSGASRRRTTCSSPHSQRASRKAVRMVMSFFASAISSLGRADRMADLELQVPQQMEDRFGRALLLRRSASLAVRNIRSRSLNGAISPRPVPPRPTSAKLAAERLVEHALGDEIVGEADDLVVEEGGGLGGGAAAARLVGQAPGDLGAAVLRAPRAGSRTPRRSASCPGAAPRSGRRARGGR